jgi:hypothetical protein
LGGKFGLPGSRSGFPIRIRWPHWIQIQSGSGSETLVSLPLCTAPVQTPIVMHSATIRKENADFYVNFLPYKNLTTESQILIFSFKKCASRFKSYIWNPHCFERQFSNGSSCSSWDEEGAWPGLWSYNQHLITLLTHLFFITQYRWNSRTIKIYHSMVKLRQAEGVVKMLRKAWHVRLKNIFN